MNDLRIQLLGNGLILQLDLFQAGVDIVPGPFLTWRQFLAFPIVCHACHSLYFFFDIAPSKLLICDIGRICLTRDCKHYDRSSHLACCGLYAARLTTFLYLSTIAFVIYRQCMFPQVLGLSIPIESLISSLGLSC